MVAPFVGVWIEINLNIGINTGGYIVAPFVGVWIEITLSATLSAGNYVAPFVGVWIEILMNRIALVVLRSRSLRGSVD